MSKYDEIIEVTKHDEIEEIEKFNPYHDRLGRFTSAGGGAGGPAVSFTIQTKDPNKQHWADMAIARAGGKPIGDGKKPEKPKVEDTTKPPKGTRTQSDHPDGHHLGTDGVEKITGASREEAEKMYKATRDFTDGMYDSIREAGFKGSPPASKSAKEKADQVDKMIDEAPKFDGQVYRGIGVSPGTAKQIAESAAQGHLISQMGAASFSTNQKTAESFGKSNAPGADGEVVLFRSKGVQNGTSVKCISEFPGEDEVLMSSKASWKPTGKIERTTIGGRKAYIIDCEPFWGDVDAYESNIPKF